MTTKHTPGPWQAENPDDSSAWYVASIVTTTCNQTAVCKLREDQAADARLIAAAPELMAALADIALVAKNGTGHNLAPVVRLAQRIEAMALSAIAKAEGR